MAGHVIAISGDGDLVSAESFRELDSQVSEAADAHNSHPRTGPDAISA
jgi:hypothetical protein